MGIMNTDLKEFQVLIVNPRRCMNCKMCMEICALVHESEYIHLTKRIIGSRKRIELECALFCDLCTEMKEEFIDPNLGGKPQCIEACPNNAIFIGIIESYKNESRREAINRIFNNTI